LLITIDHHLTISTGNLILLHDAIRVQVSIIIILIKKGGKESTVTQVSTSLVIVRAHLGLAVEIFSYAVLLTYRMAIECNLSSAYMLDIGSLISVKKGIQARIGSGEQEMPSPHSYQFGGKANTA
jgi:hypothetical protein